MCLFGEEEASDLVQLGGVISSVCTRVSDNQRFQRILLHILVHMSAIVVMSATFGKKVFKLQHSLRI